MEFDESDDRVCNVNPWTKSVIFLLLMIKLRDGENRILQLA